MLIIESSSLDVYRNLAIEEYLMDQVRDQGPVLFLWRSECAVVMGKNQNPWKECRLDLMQAEGIPLARRISGGGTVYHDEGNLNYCVIVDRENYCECDAYNLIFRALENFGIKAEKTGQSNLSVDGLKFSGNAFAFRKGRAMHHGTLLIKSDLKRLGRYLGPALEGIETKAIASVPAKVTNLDLEILDVADAVKASFRSGYGDSEPVVRGEDELDSNAIALLEDRLKDNQWRYGNTPKFFITLEGEHLEVVKGVVDCGPRSGQLFQDLLKGDWL